MESRFQRILPTVLVAVGAWLLLAALVSSFTEVPQTTNLHLATRPIARVMSLQGAQKFGPPQVKVEDDDLVEVSSSQKVSWEAAMGAAAVGMAAAGAETQHLIPMPWAATGLSLAFLAVVLFLFNQWQQPGPGLALAGAGMPKYTDVDLDEVDLAEMAAKPMAMSTSGSGKVQGEQLITVDKPLGLTLGEKSGGGVQVTFVNPMGNASKAGIKPGDTVIYTSSFFGDELWPADKLGFTRSAIGACPSPVDFVVMRGAAAEQVNVKRLPKRPAPPRIGRKLTAAEKTRATHICLDCGWIYALPVPFENQPKDYRCPQCQATKSRFAGYDAETGKVLGSQALPTGILAGVIGGVALVLVLGYIALAL